MARPENTNIGPFKKGSALCLTPVPNGGWIVSAPGESRDCRPNEVGAYSTLGEALAAIGKACGEAEAGG